MTERRLAATERAALVGLVTGAMRRTDAEQSLDELDGLAAAAGAVVVVRALQERTTADSATFIGRGKAQALALACCRSQSRCGHRRQRTHAGAVARTAGGGGRQGRRSHPADPRHLRQARAHPRRQAAGRAGAAPVPVAAAGGRQQRAVASRRRHRQQGAGRDQARDGSAQASARASRSSATTSTRYGGAAASCASGATRRSCRPWRSSAIPTPARPRSSTASRSPTRWRPTPSSSRSIRWCAGCACPTSGSCSCPTRSGSSTGCRTPSWPRFAPRSRRPPKPT